MKVSYSKIAAAGGSYDTLNYRYVIDPATGNVFRIPLSKVGTPAAFDRAAWTMIPGRSYSEKKIRTSIQLDPAVRDGIKYIADKYGGSFSEVVRSAVVEYIGKFDLDSEVENNE